MYSFIENVMWDSQYARFHVGQDYENKKGTEWKKKNTSCEILNNELQKYSVALMKK